MRNSKLIVAAAVAMGTILGIGVASAADLPARAYTKAPVLEPVYNWTGFYFGANVGYGWNDPTVSYTPNDNAILADLNGGNFNGTAIPSASYNIKGALGGGQIGYNWQFNHSWLFGLEADFDGSGLKGSAVSPFTFGFQPATMTSNQSLDWVGTARGRLGWLPTDKLVLFATGGLAYGEIKENLVFVGRTGINNISGGIGFACDVATCFSGSSSQVKTGYTVGAGFEYAILQNVSVKLEYLYVNLGQTNVTAVALNSSGQPTPSSIGAHYSNLDFNVLRVGANLHF
jgi:outer membrane immunogenic protein